MSRFLYMCLGCCLSTAACIKQPDGYDDDEGIDPCAGMMAMGGWVGCGGDDATGATGTTGACLEAMGSPIRCTAVIAEDNAALRDFERSCESQDDGYHQFTWVDACPVGMDSGCVVAAPGRRAEVTEWVYGGARCLRGGEPVAAPSARDAGDGEDE